MKKDKIKINNKIIVQKNFLFIRSKKYRCSVGKNGFNDNRQEGDKTTPKGCFKILRVFYRPDRIKLSRLKIPTEKITKKSGWGTDSKDLLNYNKLISLPYDYNHEILWRDDHIYDIVIEIAFNQKPTIPKKGSAIFLHIARSNYTHTDGCIGLSKSDMLEILRYIDHTTEVCIQG